MSHAIHWFEIPSTDLARATAFYERLLQVKLRLETVDGIPMAIFPGEQKEIRGAIIQSTQHEPNPQGTRIYLAAPDLDAALERVSAAGGALVLPKLDIGPPGFIALVRDTEGNVVGLHMPRS